MLINRLERTRVVPLFVVSPCYVDAGDVHVLRGVKSPAELGDCLVVPTLCEKQETAVVVGVRCILLEVSKRAQLLFELSVPRRIGLGVFSRWRAGPVSRTALTMALGLQ